MITHLLLYIITLDIYLLPNVVGGGKSGKHFLYSNTTSIPLYGNKMERFNR